ncbi:MAG: hypothetical protein M5U09_17925 [Gammaproteobacteria bacterium]|nr:hypothetical protein [Gammaproteobacteria bacterium]
MTRSLPSNDDLRLTQAERVWLAEHPVVRVGTDAGFAPLEFRDRDGRFRASPSISCTRSRRRSPCASSSFHRKPGPT